jgi:hypothetical protein
VLAAAIESLLPSPVTQREAPSSDDAALRVIDEAIRKVRVENIDSAHDRTKVLAFLAREVADYGLSMTDEKAATARVGQEGALKPGLYSVDFATSFQQFEGLGVRRSHVIEALGNPDSYQHIVPDKIKIHSAPALSVFAKRIDARENDAFWALVIAWRHGATLEVDASWRVYESDVSLAEVGARPIEMLQAFVSVYGLEFTLAGKLKGNFFLYETFPAVDLEDSDILRLELSEGSGLYSAPKRILSTVVHREHANTVELALAYVIDLTRYAIALGRHGVQTDLGRGLVATVATHPLSQGM